MLSIIPQRRWWYALSGAAVLASTVALLSWGVQPGIDFTGGSLLELHFPADRPAASDLQQVIQSVTGEGNLVVQPAGTQGLIARFAAADPPALQRLREQIRKEYPQAEERRLDAIGPTIGQELRKKTVWAVALAVGGMIAFISLAFRKVTRPVPSWQYGGIAIVALLHDLLITAGVFAALGHYYRLEVNAPFVAALLTVFGYSVNDTIVVFDRIRDNLLHGGTADFAQTVERSIRQTIVRSTNTSLPTLLTLLVILTFGGETVRDFALALIIGIVTGTYSSIFVACPLLVEAQTWRTARRRV